jgi:outer membrane protein TolC
MWPWKTSLVVATVSLAACSSGYQPHPLADREVLADLRAIRLESLHPACPSSSAAGPTTFDVRDGLSIDESVAVALCVNPGLRAFRATRGEAEGELVAAGILPNPELELSWLHIQDFTKSLATGAIGLGVSWQPLRPGERAAKRAAASARIGKVQEEIAGEEWRVATETRKAFVALAGNDERLRLADLALTAQRRVRDFVRKQVEGGVATKIDVGLAEIEYVSALRVREGLATDRERARQSLNRVLGLPPLAEIRLQGTSGTLAYRGVTADATALEDSMLINRPSLRAARCEYEAADHDVHVACIGRIPWVRFGPAYERDGSQGEGSVNKFGVGLGLELPIASKNEGEIAKMIAKRDRLREDFAAKVHDGRAELNEALQGVRAQERLVRLFTESVEPALDASDKLLQSGLGERELDLLRYLATQEKAIEERRAHVESLENYWNAVYDLERAVGTRIAAAASH